MDVETVRFDEYEARHPMHVDVVKIDVEDFEADVLEACGESSAETAIHSLRDPAPAPREPANPENRRSS